MIPLFCDCKRQQQDTDDTRTDGFLIYRICVEISEAYYLGPNNKRVTINMFKSSLNMNLKLMVDNIHAE